MNSWDIMDRLKAETAELHDQAEGHEFQRRLVKGELSRAEYASFLEGMFHVHRTLEGLLRDAARRDPILAAFPFESRSREVAVRRDLSYFGVEVERSLPLPQVEDLCEQMRRDSECASVKLLGHLYVLEGSTNGSHFIARAIRRAYGLEGADGTHYLDPHGDDQKNQWLLFKEQVRALPLTELHKDRMVEAARSMFEGIMRISDALVGIERNTEGTTAIESSAPIRREASARRSGLVPSSV